MTQSTELPSFHYAFQMSKKVVFELNYYRLGSNKNKHFITSAAQFNQLKTDFNHCGQAQNDLLKGHTKAMSFYKKWDSVHIQDLTSQQHADMLNDIEILKNKYNFISAESDIRFSDLKTLSKLTPKK